MPERKLFKDVVEIASFVQKLGFYTTLSKLREIPESRGGLSDALNNWLTRSPLKESRALDDKKDIGLASAIHRTMSRKAGLESFKRKWHIESPDSEEGSAEETKKAKVE